MINRKRIVACVWLNDRYLRQKVSNILLYNNILWKVALGYISNIYKIKLVGVSTKSYYCKHTRRKWSFERHSVWAVFHHKNICCFKRNLQILRAPAHRRLSFWEMALKVGACFYSDSSQDWNQVWTKHWSAFGSIGLGENSSLLSTITTKAKQGAAGKLLKNLENSFLFWSEKFSKQVL